MTPITLKSALGETIEVKWDNAGHIEVRHSDINRECFGEFHELSQRPGHAYELLEGKEIHIEDPAAQELMGRLGGYVKIEDGAYFVDANETAMILDAVKQHAGMLELRAP